MFLATRLAHVMAFCDFAMVAGLLALPATATASDPAVPPCKPPCVCVPNTQNYGYFATTWRQWPNEKRPDKTFPASIGKEVIPTPSRQSPPQEPEIVPLPRATEAPGAEGPQGPARSKNGIAKPNEALQPLKPLEMSPNAPGFPRGAEQPLEKGGGSVLPPPLIPRSVPGLSPEQKPSPRPQSAPEAQPSPEPQAPPEMQPSPQPQSAPEPQPLVEPPTSPSPPPERQPSPDTQAPKAEEVKPMPNAAEPAAPPPGTKPDSSKAIRGRQANAQQQARGGQRRTGEARGEVIQANWSAALEATAGDSGRWKPMRSTGGQAVRHVDCPPSPNDAPAPSIPGF